MNGLFGHIRRLLGRSAPPDAITQADLDAITDSCGAPREWLILRGQDVVLRASPDEDEAMLTCVLTKMSALISAHNAGDEGDAKGSENG